MSVSVSRWAIVVSLALALAGAVATRPAADEPAKVAVADAEAKEAAAKAVNESHPKPTPVPQPKPKEIDEAIAKGVRFLVTRQNKDGSWGTPHQTKGLNIYAPVPGSHQAFRSGTTALCVKALSEVGGASPEVVAALDRGEKWLLENLPKLRRATPDAIYNNWGHIFGIDALATMYGRHAKDAAKAAEIRKVVEQQLDMLVRYECVDGGWAYYDFVAGTQKPSGSTISFVTASGLIALDAAKRIGVEIPEKISRRAIYSIDRQRKPDFSYMYGEYLKMRPMHPVNRPGGSLGRSQVCNLALRLWGDKAITDDVLKIWLDRIFARNGWLDIGRKRPIPHESWFAVAGYFFYYGHYYAALCIEQLPKAERAEYQDQLAQVLLALQEKDGSWWDYPLYDYHQPYGTAFALMSLKRSRR